MEISGYTIIKEPWVSFRGTVLPTILTVGLFTAQPFPSWKNELKALSVVYTIQDLYKRTLLILNCTMLNQSKKRIKHTTAR